MANLKKVLSQVFTPFMLVLAALLCGAGGQLFLYTFKAVIPGLILFFAGIALFLTADKKNGIKLKAAEISVKTEIILFCIIMAVAVFFRLFMIDRVPAGCFVDEAQNGFDALGILQGNLPVYVGFSTHNAALYLYLIADMFRAFGTGITQIRSVSAILGILTVPAFYFLLRYTLGVRPALLGAFFLAILRWHVNFSRIGFHASFALLMFVLVIYFLYRAYKERGWGDFILLGITAGISQNTYQAARLIPVWMIIAGIYVFIKDREFFAGNYKKIAAAVLIAGVICIPIAGYALKNPDVFFQRQKEVNIFTKGVVANSYQYGGKYTPVRLFFKNIQDTLLMFNYKGDMNPSHNIPGQPVVDFMLGIFAFLGFGYMLFRLSNPVYLFFMSIFGLFIISGFITVEAPQSLRVIFIIPVVIIFAAVFLEKFFQLMESGNISGYGRSIYMGIAAGVIIMIAVNNFYLYFEKQAKNPFCWIDFATDAYTAGQYYKKLGTADWRAALAIEGYKIRTFNMAVSGQNRNDFDTFAINYSIPAKPDGKKNYTYILTPHYVSIVEPILRDIYPGGRYIPMNNRYDDKWLMYFAYEVPYGEIEKAAAKYGKNGLIFTRYRSKDWTGAPFSVEDAPAVFLDADYGEFSCEWNGRIKADTEGEYTFIPYSRGTAEVYIDGKKIVENQGAAMYGNTTRKMMFLRKGFHKIKVRYSQGNIFAVMELGWIPPKGKGQLIPYKALYK